MNFFEDIFPYAALGLIGVVLLFAIFSKGKKEKS